MYHISGEESEPWDNLQIGPKMQLGEGSLNMQHLLLLVLHAAVYIMSRTTALRDTDIESWGIDISI